MSKMRGGASASKKHCTNPGCVKPDESTMFVQVDGSSSSGGQDWSSLAGSTLCQPCFTFFKRNGSLKCEEAPASPLDGSTRRAGKEAAQVLFEGKPGPQACDDAGAQAHDKALPTRVVEEHLEEEGADDVGPDKKTARRLNVDEGGEGGQPAEGEPASRPGSGAVAVTSNAGVGGNGKSDEVLEGVKLLLLSGAGRKPQAGGRGATSKAGSRAGVFTPPLRHANGVRACVHRQAKIEEDAAAESSASSPSGMFRDSQMHSPAGGAGAAMTADEADAVALLESMRHVLNNSERKRKRASGVDKLSSSSSGPGSMQGKDLRTLVRVHDEKKGGGKLEVKVRKQRESKGQGRKGGLLSPGGGGAGGGSPDSSKCSDADGDTTPKTHAAVEPKDSQKKRARGSDDSFRKNAKYRLADQNGNVIRENLPQVAIAIFERMASAVSPGRLSETDNNLWPEWLICDMDSCLESVKDEMMRKSADWKVLPTTSQDLKAVCVEGTWVQDKRAGVLPTLRPDGTVNYVSRWQQTRSHEIVKANLRQRLFSDASIVDPVQWIVSDVNTGRIITSKQIRYVHTCKIHLKKRKAHGAAERAKTDTERDKVKVEAEVGASAGGGAGGGRVGGGEVAALVALAMGAAEARANDDAALPAGSGSAGEVLDAKAAVAAAAAAGGPGLGQSLSTGGLWAGLAASGIGAGAVQAMGTGNIASDASQVYAALHGVVTLQQEVASILPRGNGPGGAGGEAIISTPGEASGEAWNGIIVRPEAQREMPGSGPKEGGAWSGNVLQGTPFGGIAVQVKAGAAPALSPSTSAAIATAAVVAASPRVSSAEDAAASAVAPGNWEGATATADKQGEGSGVGEEGVSQQQQPGVCPEADGEDATAPSDGSVPPTKGEASSYKRILEQLGS